MKSNGMTFVVRAAAVLIMFVAGSLRAGDLEQGFARPPAEARPWVYWFWLDGNITREGITADLEAMQRVGIGGVLIMEVAVGVPKGPARFMSAPWRELFKHVASEAARLGIEVDMNNDAGWCGSGGPWITPELAMQQVVWTEAYVEGPRRFEGTLPQPLTIGKFYRDIAVLAFPTLDGDDVKMSAFSPKVTASVMTDKFQGGKPLIDGNPATFYDMPNPERGKPQYIQLEFAQPYAARSLTIAIGGRTHRYQGQLQVSDDGRAFKTIRAFSAAWPDSSFNFPMLSARYFKILFTTGDSRSDRLRIAGVEVGRRFRIENVRGKAGFIRASCPSPAEAPSAPQDAVIVRDRIVDLTSRMDRDGRLAWDVPQGKWTVLRLGHTPTGKDNHPAPDEGRGLECDKLSREAIEVHFAGLMGKLIADVGPLAGKTLTYTHIDSWEVGSQNWTPRLREEFQKRRGYDLLPYLPAMTGRAVGSAEMAERFLWDLRRTCGELLLENYAGHLEELGRPRGIQLSIEAYGDGLFDNLAYAGRADMPMTEFWAGGSAAGSKAMSSAAHVYGKPIVGAESFTATPANGKWQNHPFSLKALGDEAFCGGVNRFVFHRYALQPWLDRRPGMTMGPWGVHYERTETWWEQSAPWHEYLARCQFLLRQGRFAADVCYLTAGGAPSELPARSGLRPALPPGYDYDGCPAELAIKDMSVKDGRILLPSGMSYRVLVLAPGETLTPPLLRKIRDLIEAGATVTGARPVKSPSLMDYPKCDEEVKSLAEEIWRDCDGKKVKEHRLGKGRVVCEKTLEEILAEMGVRPDFDYDERLSARNIRWIHRTTGEGDIYLIANSQSCDVEVSAVFRVSGIAPELWHPDSGLIEPAAVYEEKDGCTRMPLRLGPSGSVFVVFRRGAAPADQVVAVTRDGQPVLPPPNHKTKIVIQKAVYGVLDDPQRTRDVRAKAQALLDAGQTSFRVAEMARGDDPAPGIVKTLIVDYTADGKALQATGQDPEAIYFTVGASPERAADLRREGNGWLLEARQPGRYELRTAGGRTLRCDVPAMPPPQEIAGPWKVQFDPKWGGPEAPVTFDKLEDWATSAEPGIKYYSGTATYRTTFKSKIQNLKSKIYLDFGRVQVIAQAKLNGKDLGILWKPPFCADVTDVLKAGENALEVSVVNLWPNRLIGDEQVPDDCEWSPPSRLGGSMLKEWPRWLLEGKPRPSGRYTFMTCKHWTKDAPLLPSGLLGPVTLRAAEDVEVK